MKRMLILIISFGMFAQRCSDKTTEIQPGVPVRVGPTDHSSSFSYYNTSPESPDGSKIAYTKFLSMPENDRSDRVPAEIWVCNTNLTDHKKVISLNPLTMHNGARVQWMDNNSFAYQDDSIRAVDLDGMALIEPVSGDIGHHTHNGKIIYSGSNEETHLSTIYEYDIENQQIEKLGDAMDFRKVAELYPASELREITEMEILHLQYSLEGSKIAFRLDIGPRNEKYRHLVTMNKDGSDIRYFGPKPMHFSWYDNESLMGHDNQVDDGLPDNKSGRRWDLAKNHIENLSGTGNHLGVSDDRMFYASESWYQQIPVILSVFKKGEMEAVWQDTISTDEHTTWSLANHANPSFSRDSKRVYYNKCVAPGVVQAYMVTLPEGL